MKKHYCKLLGVILIAFLILSNSLATALPWPIRPDSSSHLVSYYYGGWQGMWRSEWGRNVNYFHIGMDIPGGELEPVYAVESGYVKAIITIFESAYHWRIIIADSSGTEECDAWLYAHIHQQGIPFSVGDYVNAGDSLGALITWPYPNTPIHLHLSRLTYGGDSAAWANGFWDYEFSGNPITYLEPAGDTMFPFIQNAWGSQLFAFCENQTSSYFDIGEPIAGDVDIICSAYDNAGYTGYRTCPYKIEYKIEGDSSLPWTTSFEFGGSLDSYNGDMEALSHMVFKYDSQCSTAFIDNLTQFYIISNTDGDGIMEIGDTSHCWQTVYFPNGDYKIFTRISDYDGNEFTDSMTITVGNYFSLSGTVGLEGNNPNTEGIEIEVFPDNSSTVTLAGGDYSFSEINSGYQTISFTRSGFVTFDTSLFFYENHQIDIALSLGDFVCGDADLNGIVNILDVTRLISFLYQEGERPVPFEAGDANGNGLLNILDITYLIKYLYKGGPEPVCP